MRQVKLIGIALVAVLAAAAMPASSASALETVEILPSITTERSWTGKLEGTTITFVGPLNAICPVANTSGTQLASGRALGRFHIELTGCESATKKCTGLNELTAGVILMLGTWHLVWDRVKGGSFDLTVATVFLVEPLHFSCGGALLAELRGELVCLDLKPEESNETHSYHCIPELSGGNPTAKQNEEWCSKDPCTTWTVPLLLTATNGGGSKEGSVLMLGNWTVTGGEKVFTDSL